MYIHTGEVSQHKPILNEVAANVKASVFSVYTKRKFYVYIVTILSDCVRGLPITVAARFKAWTVFAHSDAGIVGSNPIQGMDVCVCVYSVWVLCVGSGRATGWSPLQVVLPSLYIGSRNWKFGESPTKGCRAIIIIIYGVWICNWIYWSLTGP
jgi:hypothetical protein